MTSAFRFDRICFIGVLLLVVAACAGGQETEEKATGTSIGKTTETFAIPDSRYRRNVEIYEHVHVLPASVMKKGEPTEGGGLSFPTGTSSVDGLGEGDVILSRHDGGMARTIEHIDRGEESVTLKLGGAHLNEVVAGGAFYFGPTRAVEFDNGDRYEPPEGFARPNGATKPETETWSNRQKQFEVSNDPFERPETFFRLGPRAWQSRAERGVVFASGNLTPLMNERLEKIGLRNHLEFVQQLLEMELAASSTMRFCRGDDCNGASPESGLARLEAFQLRGHGWFKSRSRLRYRASELVVPDVNANGTPDWREDALSDFRELPILSTSDDEDSILDFDGSEGKLSIRREFEIVPGVRAQIGYDITVGLQVEGHRPMDVATGFEVTAQGGYRGSVSRDSLTSWEEPGSDNGTCGRTSRHTWHTRPTFAGKQPTGDALRIRMRIEPEITMDFSGGIEGAARKVPFAGDYRFDQHISSPEVGNCATVAETRGYGHDRHDLQKALMPFDGDALGIETTSEASRSFERRLGYATDQLAIPGICNAAWTPVRGADWTEDEEACGGSVVVASSGAQRCRAFGIRGKGSCHNSEDVDWDDDGVPKRDDGCPCIFNPDQTDTDGHGETDPCDSDADEDGLEDWEDNCPKIVNREQEKGPIDGVGQACTPSTEYFCGAPSVRIRPMETARDKTACSFELTHLDDEHVKEELRGFIHIDEGLGAAVGPPGADVSGTNGIVEFAEGDQGRDDAFLDAEELNFEKVDDSKARVRLPDAACRAYREAVRREEPKGKPVSFRLVGECIPGDSRYRQRLAFCRHHEPVSGMAESQERIDVGQDDDDWPDPAVPNPAQGYGSSGSDSIVRRAGSETIDPSEYDYPPEVWDLCPFHENPVPKGEETDEVGSDFDSNDGSACRVKLDQGEAFSDEAISAIEHPSPIFELEFPEDVSREKWRGEYPLVDYSGDGVLAHHPGYPQPCRPAEIRRCENTEGCAVPRCSDNCPTIPNPDQEDRNDNGVGDRCEHEDSEPVDREADRGKAFGINNPHYIDQTGRLKVYDSDQDGVPDHKDNCPWDWNASQANTNGPENIRPASHERSDGNSKWHTDRRGDACDPDADGDGLGNVCDADPDGDGIPSMLDYCPNLSLRAKEGKELPDRSTNRPCEDSDGDGIQGQPIDYPPLGKKEISDRWYQTGWAGFEDVQRPTFTTSEGGTLTVGADNCPTVDNPGQYDLDHDGVGDACDPNTEGLKWCGGRSK